MTVGSDGSPWDARFPETRWSLIRRAAGRDDSSGGVALGDLCRQYYGPIYCYIRFRTRQDADAADLTQAFFAHLLDVNLPGRVDLCRGRFRAYLKTAIRHFLANERARAATQRRGGGRTPISLDEEAALEPPGSAPTAEAEFDRQWALTLIARALARLREDRAAAGQGERFAVLEAGLSGPTDESFYRQAAGSLGLTEVACRKAVSRLRRDFGQILRSEILATVGREADVEAELADLMRALAD